MAGNHLEFKKGVGTTVSLISGLYDSREAVQMPLIAAASFTLVWYSGLGKADTFAPWQFPCFTLASVTLSNMLFFLLLFCFFSSACLGIFCPFSLCCQVVLCCSLLTASVLVLHMVKKRSWQCSITSAK